MSFTIKWIITAAIAIILGGLLVFIFRDSCNYDPHPLWIIGITILLMGATMLLLFGFGMWLSWLLV